MASRTATEQFASTHAHPTLGSSERREVGALLERSLVDLLDLALMAKQAHWNLVEPALPVAPPPARRDHGRAA